MSLFLHAEEGSYSLTTAGTIGVIVLTVVLILLASFIRTRFNSDEKRTSEKKDPRFSTRQLVFSAVALALAFALSFVKIFHMPWGGSVTLCSMFFVVIIGYWYGPAVGITAAFAYGLLQFIQGGGGYILTLLQVALDYFLAFAALGVSGFFYKQKNGLRTGYIIAILLRAALHSAGGYLYWMEYMPEEFPASLTAIYPIVYNFSYILIEGVITIAVIEIPAVKRAIAYVTGLARGENPKFS